MARNQNQTANVVVTLDGKQAEKMLEVLKTKSSDLRAELKTLNDQRLTTGLTGQEAQRFDALRKELLETRRVSREVAKQVKDVDDVIRNLSTAPIKAIKDSIKTVEAQMNRLDRSTEQYAQKKEQLKKLRDELDRINGTAGKTTSTFEQIGNTVKRLASYVLVYAGFNKLTEGLRTMYNANVALSDQLADIKKTTGLMGQDLADLSNSILKIDTRTPVEQLNALAVAAGKLGISAKEDVLEFVKAGNIINVALGEDLGEDAIRSLAKLNDILGITKEMGIEKGLLATGSAINELGQSSTANEGYLVDFAQRLGGIAAQTNLTMQQVLALGSVTDQLGQSSEVSATALNKFVTTLVSKTGQVAKAVGIPLQELQQALDRSTWEGMMMVFEKLSGKGGLAAIAPLMGDLGSDGARLNAVISALTDDTSRLTNELQLSNKAFAEGNSVIKEYQSKNSSLAGIIKRIGKNISQAFQSSAIINELKKFAVYVYNTTSEFDEFGNRIKGATNIITTLFSGIVKLFLFIADNLGILVSLTVAFNAFKIAVVSAELALKAKTAALAAWTIVTKTAEKTQILFNAALLVFKGRLKDASIAMKALRATSMANPWIALATAIVSVGSALYLFIRRYGEAAREMKRFRQSISSDIARETSESEYLFSVVRRSAEGSKERKEAIDEINKRYRDYLPNLITEKTTTQELATALEQVNTALQNKVVQESKQKEVESVMEMGVLNQQTQFEEINRNFLTTTEMAAKIDAKIKEITEKALQRGVSIKGAANTVNKVIKDQFGDAVQFTSDYYNSVYQYVEGVYKQNEKLRQIDLKYKPFERKANPVGVELEEFTVTAKKTISSTGEDPKDVLKRQTEAIDLWLQKKKNALMEARQTETDINNENYISQEEYQKAVLSLEMKALEKKLAIAGLEPKEIAEIRGRILEIRQQMADDAVRIEKEIQKILLEADPVAKENQAYEERLRSLNLFGVERETLTAEQLKALELLEEQHNNNLADIDRKNREREKRRAEERYKQEVEASTGMQYDLWDKTRGIGLDQMQQELEVDMSIGNGTENEYYTRQMAIHTMRMQLLQEELDMRKKVGAETGDIYKQMSDLEGDMVQEAATHFNQLAGTYQQYGSQIGEAFGNLIGGQEDALQSLADATIDILFDVLDKMANAWIAELAASSVKNVAKAQMESLSTPDSVLTFGASGIARAAIMSGLITAALAAAKAGIKAAIRGGSGSNADLSSGGSGQRVIKTGYSVGGHTGEGPTLEVAGVVHRGEYVVPKWQMQDPVSFDYVRALETIRQTRTRMNPLPVRHGYAEGGPVSTPVSPAYDDRELKQTLNAMNRLLIKLDRQGVRTEFNISRLNDVQQSYNTSRSRGTLKG